MNKPEPNFDRDYKNGRQGELLVDGLIKALESGDCRIEVKKKSYIDAKFYVETECFSKKTRIYQPSGINNTASEFWAFVIADTEIVVFIPTAVLKRFVFHPSSETKAENNGSNPTRGKLINLPAILAILRSEIQQRLF